MPALLKANSNEARYSLSLPTPLVKNIFDGTYKLSSPSYII
jgi:hypothetical protein